MVMEKWKFVKGLGKRYKISNYGRVMFCTFEIRKWSPKGGKMFTCRYAPRITFGSFFSGGYLRVQFTHTDGNNIHMSVHRLVAEAFIPNPDNKPQVNHKDLDKTNNHISNLEWVTRAENATHAVAHKGSWAVRGEKNYRARFTKSQIREVFKKRASGMMQHQIAKEYGVNQTTICLILNNKTYKNT